MRPRSLHVLRVAWLVFVGLTGASRAARGEPWPAASPLVDVSEAHPRRDLDRGASRPGRAPLGSHLRNGHTFFSLESFLTQESSGRLAFGAMALLEVPLDRMARGPSHLASRAAPLPASWSAGGTTTGSAASTSRIAAEPTALPSPLAPSPLAPSPLVAPVAPAAPSLEPTSPPAEEWSPPVTLTLTPRFARAVVAAALRAAGLGTSDAVVDAMVERARLASLLPEVRLRAMHTSEDVDHAGTATDDTRIYGTYGANLWLEARLTWRLDRLLYADDEPTLERVRLERQSTRARLAAHVVELLVQWQRALLDTATAHAGTRSANEAALRLLETEVDLDVATAGWFTTNARQEEALRPPRGAAAGNHASGHPANGPSRNAPEGRAAAARADAAPRTP